MFWRTLTRKPLIIPMCVDMVNRNLISAKQLSLCAKVTLQVRTKQRCYLHSTCLVRRRNKDPVKVVDFDYTSPKKKRRVIDVWPNMTVEELGRAMGKSTDIVFEFMTFVDNTAHYRRRTDVINNFQTICDIIEKANLRYKLINKPKPEDFIEIVKDMDQYRYSPAEESKLKKRPPVITIMGHVDHGKTTLLDYLRKSSIVASEFGGITQHIGAFSVKVGTESVTFLDTPGHAAFSSMRNRGAHCTDIVVLVVAADDGVMEQTVESIRMAKNAKVPIIVAMNKIDKPTANIERTKQTLMMQDLVLEEFGGDIQAVPISALKGTNINELMDAIIAQAEILNLRADYEGFVEGVVIESKLDKHRGKVSTTLIQRGTLKKGDVLTAGTAYAKVKNMYDDQQHPLHQVTPSFPVEIIGWRDLPAPGDIVIQVETDKRAHEVVEWRKKKSMTEKSVESLNEIETKRAEHYIKYREKLAIKRKLGYRYLKIDKRDKEYQEKHDLELNIVVKSDVEGSLEAILDLLYTYHDQRCTLNVVHTGVGSVSISDVEIAASFNAIIYNFNIGVLSDAKQKANSEKITIKPHNVIYHFVDDVREEMNSRLPTIVKEETTGEATVMEVFLITEGKKKKIPVAGSKCTSGDLKISSMYKVLRNGEEIHRGKLASMRNLKVEVTSIKRDTLCGLRLEDSTVMIQPGDIIQAFRTYEETQRIEWDPY